MTDLTSIAHKIIKRSIDTLAEQDAYIAELEGKYNKLLEFIKNHKSHDWEFIFGAKALLKEIGEVE